MCEVFFFGTALRMDSQIPSSNPGILRLMADGRAKLTAGRSGRDSWRE
jgi:hypothetical protein